MNKLASKWVVKEDNVSIALPHFLVNIDCPQSEEKQDYRLKAIHESKARVGYDFDTLVEAMYFTEHSISKCETIYDVIDEYKKHYIRTPELKEEEPLVLRKRRRNSRY